VLLDTPTQVHIVLKKYVKYIEKTSQVQIEKLITLIFNLALTQYESTYKLRTKDQEINEIVKEDFEQMGLI
jgi:hypothetical protein